MFFASSNVMWERHYKSVVATIWDSHFIQRLSTGCTPPPCIRFHPVKRFLLIILSYYTVNRKKTPKSFCHIFHKTWPILTNFGVRCSEYVFYLTWIMSLHYRVKLMLVSVCFFVKILMLEQQNSTNFAYLR